MKIPIEYNVRSLIARWKLTLFAVVGLALVVGVLVTLLALAAGFGMALRANGRSDNATVTQSGSLSELTSWLGRDQANAISVDARVQRSQDGRPMASCEVVAVSNMTRRTDGQPTNVSLRGVAPVAFAVHDGIQIVAGRNFISGQYEAIAGRRIQDRIRGLQLGSTVTMLGKKWHIVGVFAAQGSSAFESEVWGDYNILLPIGHPDAGCSCLTVRLKDANSITGFAEQLQRDPQMQIEMINERSYYERQAGPVKAALLALSFIVAGVMGIGAAFGAMNTMNGLVTARGREIATLRAFGFSRISIVSGFLFESVFVALAGGIAGCLLVLPLNGWVTATGSTASFSEVAFALKFTPLTTIIGLVFAVLMGVIGGLIPALRASWVPVSAGLRQV
jgi:putative ABC transport system permease protein